MTLTQSLAVSALLLSLFGCATPGTQPGGALGTTANWNEHLEHIQALENFTASGKIALRTPEQAETASLQWQQQAQYTHIELSGPLGLSATTVDSDGQVVEIRQGDDYSRWLLDDAGLSTDASWKLPLRALPFWLRGIPAPELPLESQTFTQTSTAMTHLPTEFQQDGWRVEYQNFGFFEGFQLPTKMKLSKAGTSARILIKDWRGLTSQ